jgi:hypothetical protein
MIQVDVSRIHMQGYGASNVSRCIGDVSRMLGCATPAESVRSPRRQQLAGRASRCEPTNTLHCHFRCLV